MPFISPEAKITETAVGLTILPAATDSVGEVGLFQTGPCFESTNINSLTSYEQIFGLPDNDNFKHWMTGYNFLQYGNNLKVVRVIGKTSKNAGIAFKQKSAVSVTPTSVTTTRLNEAGSPTISFLTDDKLHFYFKYPGTKGNSYKVATCNYEDFDTIKITHGTVTNGPFVVGETVTDAVTGATGEIVVVGTGFIKINKVFGVFEEGEAVLESGIKVANISVDGVGTKETAVSGVTFDSLYDFSLTSDQILVVVLNSDDDVLEVFNCSLTPGTKDASGSVIYVEDYLERSSQYIYCYDNTTQVNIVATTPATALLGGTVVAPTDAEIQEGFDQYANPDSSDVWCIMLGGFNENEVIQKYVIQSIADVRKEVFVIVGPKQADVVGVALESTTLSNVIKHRVNTLSVNSSYAGYFGNYKYQEDTYNSTKRWVPLDGDIAGLLVTAGQNLSVGRFGWGYQNGLIKNITKLAWSPSKASRDDMWKKEINSVIKDGSRMLVFGNKTMLGVNNIFDVIENRLLFNAIKRDLSPFIKLYISEKNVTTTQRRFTNSVNASLDQYVGVGDVEDYRVDASDAVNTPTVKAANEFKAIVAVKPTSSIRYVNLMLYGLAANVNIEEVISNQ